jgi:hypothetical protein
LVGTALFFSAFLLAIYVGAGAYAWRVQLLPSALACVLTAVAVEALPTLWHGPALVLALSAVLQLVAASAAVQAPSLTEQQYRFDRAAVSRLPKDAELIAVLSAPFDHPPRLGGLQAGETRALRDVADVVHLQAPAHPLVFRQSAACWVQWPGEARVLTGLHPACQQVHDHFRLQPIAELDLPATREPPLRWAPPPRAGGYRIGYYLLRPL